MAKRKRPGNRASKAEYDVAPSGKSGRVKYTITRPMTDTELKKHKPRKRKTKR